MLLLTQTDFISYYPSQYIYSTAFWSITLCSITPLCIIFILWLLGYISNLSITDKKERFIPFLITSIAFFFSAFVFYHNAFPVFLSGLAIAGCVALLINSAITRFWQISGHMTAIGALLGGVLVTCFRFHIFPIEVISGLVMCCGLVCTARLYLKAHIPTQCLAGFLNGIGLTLLSSFFNWDYIMRELCGILN